MTRGRKWYIIKRPYKPVDARDGTIAPASCWRNTASRRRAAVVQAGWFARDEGAASARVVRRF